MTTHNQFQHEAGTGVDSSAGSDSGSKSDSGTTKDSGGIMDAAPDMGAQANAFTGSGTFASNPPATTAATFHMNNGVGVTPGLGVDCLGCHKMGGPGVEFLFAGTVFQDKAGTMAAADKEVRVYDSASMGFSAHSDTDGNFWFKKAATAITFPAMPGVRDAAQTALMVATITAASCNSCHDKNTTDPLHIP